MKRLFALFALLPLISIAQTAPSATVTWTAPTKNTDSSVITATLTYNLYAGTSCTALSKVQSAIATTSTTVSGSTALVPGTTYCFAVTAVASGIESAQSNTATAAIPFPTPGTPSQITVVIH